MQQRMKELASAFVGCVGFAISGAVVTTTRFPSDVAWSLTLGAGLSFVTPAYVILKHRGTAEQGDL